MATQAMKIRPKGACNQLRNVRKDGGGGWNAGMELDLLIRACQFIKSKDEEMMKNC